MAENVAYLVSSSKKMGVVTNISVSYVDVPSFSDLGNKADVEYVRQQIESTKNAIDLKTKAVESKTNAALIELKESVRKALDSKERIESEKKELIRLFDSLSSNLKKDCQTMLGQLDSEIKTYHEIDKSLNKRLYKLYKEMHEYIVANQNATATIKELSKRTALAEDASKKLKENPNLFQDLAKEVKLSSKVILFMLANLVLIDIFFLVRLFL